MSSQQTLDLSDETLALVDGFDNPVPVVEDSGSMARYPNADDSFTLLFSQAIGGLEPVHGATIGAKRDRNATPKPSQHQQARLQQKKKAARANEATPYAPTPVTTPSVTKKPRKLNHIEIRKFREQIEELQARRTQLELFGSDRPNEIQMTTAAGGAIQLSVSAAVAEQYDRTKSSEQLEAADAVTSQSSANTASSIETSTASSPRSVWLDLTVEQYKHLQHSEAWNRKLRAAVSKQLKVTNLMRSLLRMKVSPQQLAELYLNMESRFHETDLVCHGIRTSNDVNSVFSSSNTRHDEVRGPTSELTTNTPVTDGFQLLGDVMWRRFSEKNGLPVVPNPPGTQHLQPRKRAHRLLVLGDKRVCLTLASDKFGGEHQVDGVVASGKFREAHRIVITIAFAYTVSGVDIVFRESAWIVISEDAEDATYSSTEREAIGESSLRPLAPSAAAMTSLLFQTFYRLHTKKRDPRTSTGSLPFTDVLDETTKNVLGMKLLSDQLRRYMTQLQNAMLSEVGLLVSNMMDVKCPIAECLS